MTLNEGEPIIRDQWGIAKNQVKINTGNSLFNEDINWSDLNERERGFILRRVDTIRLIKDFFEVSKDITKDTTKIKNAGDTVISMFKNYLDSLVILSRSKGGRIIKHSLKIYDKELSQVVEQQTNLETGK